MERSNGFTLIETLIALVIFSVMAAGFMHYVTERANQAKYLTNKTLASIVASNAITEIQISGQWPDIGKTTNTIPMADRNWPIAIDIQNTDYPDMRRLVVDVSPPAAPGAITEEPILELIGFVGKN